MEERGPQGLDKTKSGQLITVCHMKPLSFMGSARKSFGDFHGQRPVNRLLTANISWQSHFPIKIAGVFHFFVNHSRKNAFPMRFERTTFRLGGGRSILLSYGNMPRFWLKTWVFQPRLQVPVYEKPGNFWANHQFSWAESVTFFITGRCTFLCLDCPNPSFIAEFWIIPNLFRTQLHPPIECLAEVRSYS